MGSRSDDFSRGMDTGRDVRRRVDECEARCEESLEGLTEKIIALENRLDDPQRESFLTGQFGKAHSEMKERLAKVEKKAITAVARAEIRTIRENVAGLELKHEVMSAEIRTIRETVAGLGLKLEAMRREKAPASAPGGNKRKVPASSSDASCGISVQRIENLEYALCAEEERGKEGREKLEKRIENLEDTLSTAMKMVTSTMKSAGSASDEVKTEEGESFGG